MRLVAFVCLVLSLVTIGRVDAADDRFRTCYRQCKISGQRDPAEGAGQRYAGDGRRAEACRLRGHGWRKPLRRRHAAGDQHAVRQDQARRRRDDFLLRLRHPVRPPELHDSGGWRDLGREGRPPRRHQPQFGAERDEQPRRRREDRDPGRVAPQPVRAPLPPVLHRPGSGDRTARHAGDVFGASGHRRQRLHLRSQPVRDRTAEGNPRPQPDRRGGVQPHPRRRFARLQGRPDSVVLVLAGRGVLVRPAHPGQPRPETAVTGTEAHSVRTARAGARTEAHAAGAADLLDAASAGSCSERQRRRPRRRRSQPPRRRLRRRRAKPTSVSPPSTPIRRCAN